MPDLLIQGIDAQVVEQLERRAQSHGGSPEGEAKQILCDALRPVRANEVWAKVDEIFAKLSDSGRPFDDSVELLREDRER
jgi:plasmid stability protein